MWTQVCMAMKDALGRRFGWARVYYVGGDSCRHTCWYVLKYVLKGMRVGYLDDEETRVTPHDRWGIWTPGSGEGGSDGEAEGRISDEGPA